MEAARLGQRSEPVAGIVRFTFFLCSRRGWIGWQRRGIKAQGWERGSERRTGEQGLEEEEERVGEHGDMFGELTARWTPDPSPNSISRAFPARNDRWDKMRSKVTLSSPNAPTSPPTRSLSLPLCASQCESPDLKISHRSLFAQP